MNQQNSPAKNKSVRVDDEVYGHVYNAQTMLSRMRRSPVTQVRTLRYLLGFEDIDGREIKQKR